MSIVTNKDIYDPSQGNPFQIIMDYLADLDKAKAKISKSMSDNEMKISADDTGLKEKIKAIQNLNNETERYIAVEKTKAQVETSLRTITDTYTKSVIDSTSALKNNTSQYDQAISKMANLTKDIETIKKALESAKKAMGEGGGSIDAYAKEVSDLTVKLEIQKKALKDTTLLAKNLEVANRSGSETIEVLKAQLSSAVLAWNKLTAAEIENSEEGKRLQTEMASIQETLRVLEMDRGQSGRNVGKYAQSLKGLRIELRELKGIMASSAEGTKEYNDAMLRAAQITDLLDDNQKKIRGTAMDFEGVMGNVVKVTQGVGDMFQIATGAQALFGIESEDLMKTLVKLQALMALTQGLQGLDGLGKSFKNLLTQIKFFAQGVNKALLATGIGAIIVALGLVIAYWNDIKKVISGVSTEQEKLYENTKKSTEQRQRELKALESSDALLKSQGYSEREILKLKINKAALAIKSAHDELIALREITKAQIEAEARNQDNVKSVLDFVAAGLTGITRLVDIIGKAFGKDWKLTEQVKNFASGFLFDADDAKKKGEEEIKASEDKLNELLNSYEQYKLELKELDKKSAEDKKTKDDEAFKREQELFKERRKFYEDEIADNQKLAKDASDIFQKTFEEDQTFLQALRDEEEKAKEEAAKREEQRKKDLISKLQNLDSDYTSTYKNAINEQIAALVEAGKEEEALLTARKAIMLDLASAATEQFAFMVGQGKATFESFGRTILALMLDVTEKLITMAIARIWAESIAQNLFAGIAKAAILTAVVKGVFAGLKARILAPVNKYATGTDRVNGNGSETSDSIPAMLSRNEGVIPASINKQLLGLGTGATDKNLPYLVSKGMNSIYIEAALQRIDDNTARSAWLISNLGNHWVENGKHYYKDVRTGQIHIMPEA